ncbi:MAG: YgiT-type zinc finger protein [Acidimicrobiales bacterium]
MRCSVCDNGERATARLPFVDQRGSHVAVVTDVPVGRCSACGEIWLDEAVALRLDGLLSEMLRAETVAVRPFDEDGSVAA